MKRIRHLLTVVALGTATAGLVSSRPAEAHWCDDLWNSGYNIVVRVDADTITVPASGTGTVDVRVQNNMGYPLKGFKLSVVGSGFTATVTRATEKKSGFLLPGESAKYTVTITKSGGGTVQASGLNFYVQFGGSGQSARYSPFPGSATPSNPRPVAIKTPGGLIPGGTPGLSEDGNSQALHLNFAAQADFGQTATGIDNLIQTYCAGRESWSQSNGEAVAKNCTNASSTSCPTTTNRIGQAKPATKFDFDRLWAVTELAARKSALGAKADVVRARLKCGVADSNLAFSGMAYIALGYLGENADARSTIETAISSGSADVKAIAKAAIALMGKAEDKTTYEADVRAGLSSSNKFVAASCAAALGIAWKDDSAVENVLVKNSDWVEPDSDASDGSAFYAAHMLALVAWDRRGWAANAGDTTVPSFYPGGSTTTDPEPQPDGGTTQPTTGTPAAPGNVKCSVATDGKTIRVTWDAVSKDTTGAAVTPSSYKLYYGNTARPGTATKAGQGGFDYAHVNTVSSTSSDLTDAAGKEYIAVTAIAGGVASNYSSEVSCTSSATPDPQGETGGTTNPDPGGNPGAGGSPGGTTPGTAGNNTPGGNPGGTPGGGQGGSGTNGSGNGTTADGGASEPPKGGGGCAFSGATPSHGVGALILAIGAGLASRLRRRRRAV